MEEGAAAYAHLQSTIVQMGQRARVDTVTLIDIAHGYDMNGVTVAAEMQQSEMERRTKGPADQSHSRGNDDHPPTG